MYEECVGMIQSTNDKLIGKIIEIKFLFKIILYCYNIETRRRNNRVETLPARLQTKQAVY